MNVSDEYFMKLIFEVGIEFFFVLRHLDKATQYWELFNNVVKLTIYFSSVDFIVY